MNFFKTVFSDDLTPPDSPTSATHPASSASNSTSDPGSNPPPSTSTTNLDPWSFAVMIQKLATKSESVIDTYRRDLEDLGSGLRKETAVIREVASRAVKDLPASLEASASAAQESLETVGQAIDDIGATVWKSTAQIVNHGNASASSDSHYYDHDSDSSGAQVKPYSRYDAQLRAIQSSLNTYCTEPDDKEGYDDWRLGLRGSVVELRREEIEKLLAENEVVREIYDEVMPSKVNIETFWNRYFYRVQKLKEAEEARAKIVKRAISAQEEDLSWDFDDDDDEEHDTAVKNKTSVPIDEASAEVGDENVHGGINAGSLDEQSSSKKVEEENVEPGKDDDASMDVEELGWDEIEDTGSNGDGEKVGAAVSRVDLRKRLSCAEEDEDLSWDIDDEEDDRDNKPARD
ncbi:BSD domain-containing protein 1 [Linum perenne]